MKKMFARFDPGAPWRICLFLIWLTWLCLAADLRAQAVWPDLSQLGLSDRERDDVAAIQARVLALEFDQAQARRNQFALVATSKIAKATLAFVDAHLQYCQGDVFGAEASLAALREGAEQPAAMRVAATLAEVDYHAARLSMLRANQLADLAVQDARQLGADWAVAAALLAKARADRWYERFDSAAKQLEAYKKVSKGRPEDLFWQRADQDLALQEASILTARMKFDAALASLKHLQPRSALDQTAVARKLAQINLLAERDAEGIRVLTPALARIKKGYGESHFVCCDTQADMALLLKAGGTQAEVEAAFKSSLGGWKSVFGNRLQEYPRYHFIEGIAQLSPFRGFEGLLRAYANGIKARELVEGQASPALLSAMCQAATFKLSVDPVAARREILQATALAEQHLPPGPAFAFVLRKRGAISRRLERDFAGALRHLQRSRKMAEAFYVGESPGLLPVLEELHATYKAAGNEKQRADTAALIAKLQQQRKDESIEDIERQVAALNQASKTGLAPAAAEAQLLMKKLLREADQLPDNITLIQRHALKMSTVLEFDDAILTRLAADPLFKTFTARAAGLSLRAAGQ